MARTVTVTKAMLNIVWARKSVDRPRETPRATKNDAKAAPRTISGAEMERKMTKSAPARPRNR